jgi:hypothetical protein
VAGGGVVAAGFGLGVVVGAVVEGLVDAVVDAVVAGGDAEDEGGGEADGELVPDEPLTVAAALDIALVPPPQPTASSDDASPTRQAPAMVVRFSLAVVVLTAHSSCVTPRPADT